MVQQCSTFLSAGSIRTDEKGESNKKQNRRQETIYRLLQFTEDNVFYFRTEDDCQDSTDEDEITKTSLGQRKFV